MAYKEFSPQSTAIGYFATTQDIPADWTICADPQRDIFDVMKASRCTKEQALVMMNEHWQK